MEENKNISIEVRPVSTASSLEFAIEGEVELIDDDWHIRVVPVIAMQNEDDELTILNLSIKDNDELVKMLNERFSNTPKQRITAFKLHGNSEISNARLFNGKELLPLSLKIQIDLEDQSFLSAPVNAFVRRNPSATRKARKHLTQGTSIIGILSLFCFGVWGGNPFAGTWVTVCAGGCIGPGTCECVGKGGGVCTGWLSCACGFSIFGVHVPIGLLIILSIISPIAFALLIFYLFFM